MKHERRVIIHSEQLKKLRNNLREIIINATYDEIEILRNYSSLYDSHDDLPPEEEVEVFFLQGTKQELSDLLDDSICVCPLCTNSDKDMVYIPEHKSWYCIECQDQGRIWYPWYGSEEDRRQNDYINWYYE